MASFDRNSSSSALLQSPDTDLSSGTDSSTAFVETNFTDHIVVENEVNRMIKKKNKNILACPICFERLASSNGDLGLSLQTVSGSILQCSSCRKTYSGNEIHFELIAAGGDHSSGDSKPLSCKLFSTRLVSFLYERGWRQSFSLWGGFPGLEREFEMIKRLLEPVAGGNIVDACCGSGLFSRLFAKSGLFSHVVALDYSENMLKQCNDFIKLEENFPKENISLVRADITRLPFVSNSIDAIHAGAALHCLPEPLSAISEIGRVLRPGGVFVATTFIADGPFRLIPFSSNIAQKIRQLTGYYIPRSESELEDICKACGLVGITCTRNRLFAMISATKPA